MAVDLYILALWFAYSLAFAISVAFLYYAYRKSVQQMAMAEVKVETTYFVDVKDEVAYAILELAEETVDKDPRRSVELAKEALDRLLEAACRTLGMEATGTIEEKVKRLQEAGIVFPPEFFQASKLRRPREIVGFVEAVARFFREAPVMVRKSEGPSL